MKHLNLILLLICLTFTYAEDRVLLIGIENYQDPNNSLNGPAHDLYLMEQVSVQLNFSKGQIRTLKDSEATRNAILQEFSNWLVSGTNPGDRVLLYFSGHGFQHPDQNNDEKDNCDEALVTYEGESILDDDLGKLLNQLPQRDILIIVDSCFSGTITKGVNSAQTKLLPVTAYCGLASNLATRDATVEAALADLSTENNESLVLTATGENQLALAALRPGEGSLFTELLFDWVTRNETGTFEDLRKYLSEGIRKEISNYDGLGLRPFNPQLYGPYALQQRQVLDFARLNDPSRTSQTIPTTTNLPLENQIGNYNDLFDTILRDTSGGFNTFESDKITYKDGELIILSVVAPINGYLNVLHLGAKGDLKVLFPNQYTLGQNNQVTAGELLTLPGARFGEFRIRAGQPYGVTRLIAMVTTKPLNLYDNEDLTSILKSYTDEDLSIVTRQVAEAITRDVYPEPDNNIYYAAGVSFKVEE